MVDWAHGVKPYEAAVCFDKVRVYYDPPDKAKECCEDWKISEPRYPNTPGTVDISPIPVHICQPPHGFNEQLQVVTVEYFIQKAVFSTRCRGQLREVAAASTLMP